MLGTNYAYRLNLKSATPAPLPLNQYPKAVSSAVVLYQPLVKQVAVIGFASPYSATTLKGSLTCIGTSCTNEENSPCDNPKGCKTFWIDIKG